MRNGSFWEVLPHGNRFPCGKGGGREFIFSLSRKFIKSFYDYAASHRPFQSQVCSWMWVESFIDFRVVRRGKIVLYARKCTKSSSIPRRGPLPTSVAIGFACGDSTIGAELRLNSAVVLNLLHYRQWGGWQEINFCGDLLLNLSIRCRMSLSRLLFPGASVWWLGSGTHHHACFCSFGVKVCCVSVSL